jgi:excisionase family DNA binding protein
MLYTVKQVAERYAVTADTVWRWIREGHIEAIDISPTERKRYRITQEALEKFEKRTDVAQSG